MASTSHFRLRPLASADVVEIFSYIDQNNPPAADRFIAELDRTLALLSEMRGMGTLRQTRGRLKGLRSWPLTSFGPYVIFYIPRSDGIDVVRILHGARDIDAVLRES